MPDDECTCKTDGQTCPVHTVIDAARIDHQRKIVAGLLEQSKAPDWPQAQVALRGEYEVERAVLEKLVAHHERKNGLVS